MGVHLEDAESDVNPNEDLQDTSMEDNGTVYTAQLNESADTSLKDAVTVETGSEETDAAELQLMQEQQQGHQHRTPAHPFPGATSAAAPGQCLPMFMRMRRLPRVRPFRPVADCCFRSRRSS